MKYSPPTLILFIILPGILPQLAIAQDTPWDLEFSAGIEIDDNVTVDELDRDSAEGDSALTLSGKVGYELALAENSDLDFNYSFSQTNYDEFDEFDLRTQIFSVKSNTKVGKNRFGGTLRAVEADLDSDGFLSLQQASVFGSRLLNRDWLVRAEYTYSDKEFDDFAERDSDKHALGIDVYRFMNGVKEYWIFGYKAEDEDAEADPFDRTIHSLKLRYNRRVIMFGRESRLKLGARYQLRDYDSITPAIGAVRDDDRTRLSAELEIPLYDEFFVNFELEYSDNSSNLPSADYSQTLLGVQIGWRNQ